MNVRQIRVSIETRAMIEELKSVYIKEKFKDEQVMMTPGYILNSAYDEVKDIQDWDKVINSVLDIDNKFVEKVKETKTQIIRFRLNENTSKGIDTLTKRFSEELGLRVQTGFTAKLILKASLLKRKNN